MKYSYVDWNRNKGVSCRENCVGRGGGERSIRKIQSYTVYVCDSAELKMLC
jgi:hypothetical protein